MSTQDLDKLDKERVTGIADKAFEVKELNVNDLFLSERAARTITAPKVLQQSFRIIDVLAVTPFTSNLYAYVCPRCIDAKSVEQFRVLASSGLVMPVLIAPYRFYDDAMLSTLAQVEHISYQEYSFYRYFRLWSNAQSMLCPHCLKKSERRIKSVIQEFSNRAAYLDVIKQIERNLHPYVYPDADLLDEARTACERRRLTKLTQLERLSRCVRNVRSSQVFSASVEVDVDALAHIPSGVIQQDENKLREVMALRKFAADGLGLKIPEGIPLPEYIEIVKDYRPKIVEAVDSVLFGNDGNKAQASIDRLSRRIQQVNREIERIKGLKRYAFWEACTAFVRDNGAVAATALTSASILGAGHLLGCASFVASAGVARFAKKKGWLKENAPAKRLGKMIVRDLEPQVNKLVAKYVGTTLPTINVLSLRRKLERNRAALPT